MSETDLVRAILLKLSRDHVRLFRNNVGVLQDIKGNYIRYGLAQGSSDLIGFRRIVVEPEMVGNRLAVFVAIECKSESGRLTAEQQAFLALVNQAGGIAGVARSIEEAEMILKVIDITSGL